MNRDDFITTICDEIKEKLKEEYDIAVNVEHRGPVIKTNQEKDAINIIPEGSNISPTIYTDDLYLRYQEGTSIDEIVSSVSKTINNAIKESPQVPEISMEEAKKHITLCLINTEKNQKLLENVPHFQVGGANSSITAIARWYVSDNASFIVNNGICATLNLTEQEVLAIGQANINSNAEQFTVRGMSEIMRDMMGMDDEMLGMMMPEEDTMIVISNVSGVNGSNAILSEIVLKQVSERIGSEFYILPSSLHECICVPGNLEPEELRTMVREVNSTQVAIEDYLADGILHYDGEKLTFVSDDIKMDDMGTNGQQIERDVRYAAMHM